MSETTTALTQGVHHLGLTVPDLDRARRFFTEVLRFRQVGGRVELIAPAGA